jgi:hypothetical protein
LGLYYFYTIHDFQQRRASNLLWCQSMMLFRKGTKSPVYDDD